MTDNTRLNQNETIDAEPQEIEAAEQIQRVAAKHSEVSHPQKVKQVNFKALRAFAADRLEVERLVHAMNIEADDEDALTVLFYL